MFAQQLFFLKIKKHHVKDRNFTWVKSEPAAQTTRLSLPQAQWPNRHDRMACSSSWFCTSAKCRHRVTIWHLLVQ